MELEEHLGGRLSACTGLKLDLPTVCHYSVPVKAGSKKEDNNTVEVWGTLILSGVLGECLFLIISLTLVVTSIITGAALH